MNKHIVKHIVPERCVVVQCVLPVCRVRVAYYLDKNVRQWLRIWVSRPLWVLQGKCSIFGALCPSKSGLMNKHIGNLSCTSSPDYYTNIS